MASAIYALYFVKLKVYNPAFSKNSCKIFIALWSQEAGSWCFLELYPKH